MEKIGTTVEGNTTTYVPGNTDMTTIWHGGQGNFNKILLSRLSNIWFTVFIAEYVLSLGAMSEEKFKEAITDQYSDLYWDEDLLHDMYEAVTGGEQSRRFVTSFSASWDRLQDFHCFASFNNTYEYPLWKDAFLF